MKVLFLGNDYHPLSVACLGALLRQQRWTITAGIHDPRGGSSVDAVRTLLRTKGPRAVALRSSDVLMSVSRLRLRRAGMKLPGLRSMREAAIAYGCDTIEVERINSGRSLERIRALQPDLIAVANFSQILRHPILAIPRKGCINVHPSLLPAYRGPTPCYWVLANRESTTGVTVHYVDTGIDSGDIIAQRRIPIRPSDTERSLRSTTASVGAELIVEAVQQIARGAVNSRAQDEALASYYSFPPRGVSVL